MFKAIDENGDGHLEHSELRALIVGIQFNEMNLDSNDAVEKVMKDFDSSNDVKVDLQEFIAGVERWLAEARGGNSHHPDSMKYIDDFHRVFLSLCSMRFAFLYCRSTTYKCHLIYIGKYFYASVSTCNFSVFFKWYYLRP